MWNKIMSIISSLTNDKDKLEGKVILRQLDDEEGKKEAEQFIKKHSKQSTWRSWD